MNAEPTRRNKGRIAAALLAFFFGGFGAHRFYLGQWGLGLLYLLFFWTMAPAVAALVDFVLLLAMTDERFAALHGDREGGGGVVAAGATAIGLLAWGSLVALALPRLPSVATPAPTLTVRPLGSVCRVPGSARRWNRVSAASPSEYCSTATGSAGVPPRRTRSRANPSGTRCGAAGTNPTRAGRSARVEAVVGRMRRTVTPGGGVK